MKQHSYRKVTTIQYNNKIFAVFKDERSRYAFLRLDENNKFHYPELKDLVGLIDIFQNRRKGIAFFKKKRSNKFAITVSALLLSEAILCSSVLIDQLSKDNNFNVDDVTSAISVSDDYDATKDATNIDNNDFTVSNDDEATYLNEVVDKTPNFDISTGYQIPSYWNNTHETTTYKKLSEHEVMIYDSVALDKFFGYESVTLDQIKTAINNNSEFSPEMKAVAIDFAETIMNYYPGIDMRIFYENIKSVKLYSIEDSEKPIAAAEAWYDYYYNSLYVSKYIDLKEGSHDMIVFRHELGHMLNLTRTYQDGTFVIASMENENYGHYIQEAANVIVTTYPFQDRYTDENLGLPLISNELRLILEATPDFDPRNLVGKNINNLERFLDTNNSNSISAEELFDIMEVQTTEYYDSRFKGNRQDYAKIYEYIAETYINNVFTDDMSEEEIEEYRQYLIYNLTKCLANQDLVILDSFNERIDEYLENRKSRSL